VYVKNGYNLLTNWYWTHYRPTRCASSYTKNWFRQSKSNLANQTI